ncbi:MAG: ABC transporter permease subunit, partial [Candidatus Puniceispirillaceae bacterium]
GMCFAAVVIQARLCDFDRAIEEAACDLGARQPFVFFSVTLPVILPAVIAAWLLAFTLSFDDLVIASFVSGPGSSTLPILVFSKVRLGVTPEINALASVMIGIVAISVISAAYFMRRRFGNPG